MIINVDILRVLNIKNRAKRIFLLISDVINYKFLILIHHKST